jgi:alkylation response protein AidB-like acyl-CoA dehydrogenase
MASFFTDNEDLLFHFDEAIDWATLAEVTEYGWRTKDGWKKPDEAKQFYREVAEMMGELVAEQLAPFAAKIDREGTHLKGGEAVGSPSMQRFFDAARAAELHKLCVPRELGGLNAPLLLYFLCGEMIGRADVSSMTHFSFHGGMAMAALVYSIHEGTTDFDVPNARLAKTRFQHVIDELTRGEAWGCMDITEPDAGSDMAALRTVGEQDEHGQWFVSGQKIFVTSGHGKWHFVIARTEARAEGEDSFAGLKGLSMFLVQTYEDLPDGSRKRLVALERVEEKIGHHGSVTASLSFEHAPAQLIGKRGEGFKYMLVLMNNARVGVGFESIGLCESAYRMAKAYADERWSMGKPIAQHELIADLLDEMRTDVQALRTLAVASATHEEMSQKLALFERFDAVSSDEERQRVARELPYHRARSRRFTPLLKYLAAEKAVEIARRNMQIHGGVGYTQEYGAEKLLRDALVLPIYEGTSQIQSLMAMKDTLLGLLKKPQAFVTRIAQAKWRAVSARDELERRVARVESLSLSAQQFLLTRTAAAKFGALLPPDGLPITEWKAALTTGWDPKRDFALAMLHAERLTRLLADEAICELLLAQAKAHPKRRELLERYLDRAELRCRALHEEITTTGTRILTSLRTEQRDASAAQ